MCAPEVCRVGLGVHLSYRPKLGRTRSATKSKLQGVDRENPNFADPYTGKEGVPPLMLDKLGF